MSPILLATVIGALVAVVVWQYFERGAKKRLARFSGRENMSLSEQYKTYLQNSGVPKDEATNLLKTLAHILELPEEKLRPTDRFDSDLAPEKGFEFDDQMSGVFGFIAREYKRAGVKPEYSEIQTVRDFVLAISSLKKK